MKVVLFTLSGQGDVTRFVVPVSVYEWMHTIRPGEYMFPESVINNLLPFKTPYKSDWETFTRETHVATKGSYENDVALAICCICKHYDSLRQVIRDVQKHGWELADEYDGEIY